LHGKDDHPDKHAITDPQAAKAALYRRLHQSVKQAQSPGELAVFRAYFEHFGKRPPDRLPALVPQVYLQYDPYTRRDRGQDQVLVRQRMDFLLLLANGVRVVIEVDGQHHYASESAGRCIANPRMYAAMASEDRRLRLNGYEVYRFGGFEFMDFDPEAEMLGPQARALVVDFFESLFQRHDVPS